MKIRLNRQNLNDRILRTLPIAAILCLCLTAVPNPQVQKTGGIGIAVCLALLLGYSAKPIE